MAGRVSCRRRSRVRLGGGGRYPEDGRLGQVGVAQPGAHDGGIAEFGTQPGERTVGGRGIAALAPFEQTQLVLFAGRLSAASVIATTPSGS